MFKRLYEKLLKPLLGPVMLAFGIFYFTFHVLTGERGVYAMLKEDRKLELLKAELGDVANQRKDLEHRVRLLSDGSLDLDLLDEQARAQLNKAGADEVVIPVSAASSDLSPSAN